MSPLWLILMLMGYLAGSIPFGLIIAQTQGIDIRTQGSGNIGATNVGRVLGKKPGLICFALDVIKGFTPTLAAGIIMHTLGHADLSSAQAASWLAVMISPVVGHMFSPWIGFKGGKGVATALGAMLGFYPILTLAALGTLLIWIAALWLSKMVSLSSCAAALALPILAVITIWNQSHQFAPGSLIVLGVCTLLACLVIFKHRSNLVRIMKGTETRVSWIRGK